MRHYQIIGLSIIWACSTDPIPENTASERLLNLYDLDGDDILDESEFQRIAHPDLAFETVDIDGNGTINADELHQLLMRESPLLENHRG